MLRGPRPAGASSPLCTSVRIPLVDRNPSVFAACSVDAKRVPRLRSGSGGSEPSLVGPRCLLRRRLGRRARGVRTTGCGCTTTGFGSGSQNNRQYRRKSFLRPSSTSPPERSASTTSGPTSTSCRTRRCGPRLRVKTSSLARNTVRAPSSSVIYGNCTTMSDKAWAPSRRPSRSHSRHEYHHPTDSLRCSWSGDEARRKTWLGAATVC